jgi:GntR family transcriptional regulator
VRSEAPTSRPIGASPYLTIASELRAAIEAGRLVTGDVLPTVQDLAVWYAVSHGTAQRAIARLGTEGLVTLRRGARTLVAGKVEAAS